MSRGGRAAPDILLLTNAVAPDKLGGLERYVRGLAAALVREGVDVAVVGKRILPHSPGDEVGDDGVRLIRYDVPSKQSRSFAVRYPWQTWRSLRAILAEHPRAVLHAHFPLPAMSLLRPFGSGRRPYLYTLHAPVHKELLSERQGTYALPGLVQGPVVGTLRRVEAAVAGQAARVVVLSDFMRTQVAELDARAGAEALHIPGGVDTGWFRPGDRPYEEPFDPLLFTARRLTPRTGVTELVAAMTDVVNRHPRARLAIAGDGHLRAAVQADIEARGLAKNVELLGRIGDAELRSWYRLATCTIMPTAELEGFGLSTAESLLCGTPVLVTPVGANPELVRGLDPRFVTPDAGRDGIARGIIALLDDPGVLAAARRQLPGPRAAAWSWDRAAAQHLDLYRTRPGFRR